MRAASGPVVDASPNVSQRARTRGAILAYRLLGRTASCERPVVVTGTQLGEQNARQLPRTFRRVRVARDVEEGVLGARLEVE